jgi:hypothetical protein
VKRGRSGHQQNTASTGRGSAFAAIFLYVKLDLSSGLTRARYTARDEDWLAC